MQLGEQVSAIREQLKQAALSEAQAVKASEIDFLQDAADKTIKKIRRGYANKFKVQSADIEQMSTDIAPLERK